MPHLHWDGETVKLTSLEPPEIECSGRVAYAGDNHIWLVIAQPLPASASVRIDGPGFVVLGDVCSSEPTAEGYVVYIEIVHIAPDPPLSAATGA